jgi:hypothetical protein
MFQFRVLIQSYKNIIKCAVSHLKPEKSKRQYEKCYSDFETDVTRRMWKPCRIMLYWLTYLLEFIYCGRLMSSSVMLGCIICSFLGYFIRGIIRIRAKTQINQNVC